MSKLRAKKPEEVGPGHSKILLFGKSGAGKTWLALSFPKPYFIDTEGGASLAHYMKKLKDAGGAYFGPEDGACDFDTLLEEIKSLATEKHEFKTLVIDSITKVFQMAIAKEAERLGDKDAFGASKKPAVAYMRRLLNWTMRLDMNVVFIAHEITEWGTIGGQRQEIGKGPDVWDKLVYDLHLALRVEHPSPTLRTATVTKSRLLGFPEFERITLQDEDRDQGYAEFAKRYGRDYIEAAPTQIELATKDQIEECKKLLKVLKLEDGDFEKVLTKAKVDAMEDLSREQMTKTIEWLKGKVQ